MAGSPTWIAQRGAEGLHHICYEVGDIEEALRIAVRGGRKAACL